LAQFRAAFNERVRIEVVRYPAFDEFLDGGAAFDLLVDAVVAQICALGGRDPYYLAGYSFGGFVAWEAARRLIEGGNDVGFLGLIDTRVAAPRRRGIYQKVRDYVRSTFGPKSRRHDVRKRQDPEAIQPFDASVWGACRAVYADLELWFFDLLARKCSSSMLRHINRLAKMLPGSAGVMFEWELTSRLRIHAFRRVTIKPLDVGATLFRSDEGSDDSPDHGWESMCRQLVVLPIRGGHLSLFDDGNREMLCSTFVQSVEAAKAVRRTTMGRTGS
jgi:phthiocerol/phenolphthiocerol synthesis type-I polyketide synthase D